MCTAAICVFASIAATRLGLCSRSVFCTSTLHGCHRALTQCYVSTNVTTMHRSCLFVTELDRTQLVAPGFAPRPRHSQATQNHRSPRQGHHAPRGRGTTHHSRSPLCALLLSFWWLLLHCVSAVSVLRYLLPDYSVVRISHFSIHSTHIRRRPRHAWHEGLARPSPPGL
jgi:hypothetical protein